MHTVIYLLIYIKPVPILCSPGAHQTLGRGGAGQGEGGQD